MRELTRYRSSLVEDRTHVVNRLQKVLEDTNIKLGDVATDILGKSARAMLEAMLGGQTDPKVLAELARGRMRAKRAELEQALVGVFKPHHRFLLTELLAQVDTLDEAITRVGNEIATRMQEVSLEQDQAEQPASSPETEVETDEKPPLTWAQAIVLLCSIPGISRRAAEGILAEIGLDMTRFPSADPTILPRGPVCALATMKVLANGSAARRAKAVPLYASSSWRRLMGRLIARIPISLLNTIVWLHDAERRKRWWLWDTPF